MALAASIASGIGGIASALGSIFGGSSANSAKESYIYSKALQENQYDLNRKTRKTSFQDTRYSLEHAGYNPLLAVNQQAQGGTYGASLSVQDPKSENLANKLSALQTMSGLHLNSAQANLHNKNAFASVINALNQTRSTNASVANANAQTIGQNIQNNIQSMYGAQTALATLNNIKASTNNTNVNSMLQKAQTNVAKATVGLVNSQTGLTQAQTSGQLNSNVQSARTAQWIKQHPTLSGIGVGAQQLGTPITSAVTGLAGLGFGAGINHFMNPHRPVGFR